MTTEAPKRGVGRPALASVSDADREEMLRLARLGVPYRQIAAGYGVTGGYVRALFHRMKEKP